MSYDKQNLRQRKRQQTQFQCHKKWIRTPILHLLNQRKKKIYPYCGAVEFLTWYRFSKFLDGIDTQPGEFDGTIVDFE